MREGTTTGQVQEFKDYGYNNEIEALHDITSNYTNVYEQPNGRLLLVKRDSRGKFTSVELQNNDKYYGVTTWFLEDAKPKSKTPYKNRGGRSLLLPVAQTDDSGQPSSFPANSSNDNAIGSRRSNQNNNASSIVSDNKNINTLKPATINKPDRRKLICFTHISRSSYKVNNKIDVLAQTASKLLYLFTGAAVVCFFLCHFCCYKS